MASASPLKDIEDSYFECSYCLENFEEPKLLPCVHRFCRNCLKEIIGELATNFNCLLCNHQCAIPTDGADGFRTDFHMKSLLQYIQLQQSAKTGETKECAGCSEEAKITSYCFKCKGFLCDQCNQIHMRLKMMQEHKPSVLSLKDIGEQKLTLEKLEKLSALTETPRCHTHVDRVAEVCCESCNNLPICMVCGHHGVHEGHKLRDVKLLAHQERETIGKSLATVQKYRANVQQLPIMVEEAKSKLSENISDSKEKLQIQYIKETEKIGRQLQEIDDVLEMNKAEIDEVEKREVRELEQKREEEIEAAVNKINEQYDTLINEEKTKNLNIRDDQENLYGKKRSNVNRKLGFIDKEYKDLNTSIDMQGDENLEEIGKISDEANNRKKRFDNFRSSASSILASKNDWTHAQCLPDINHASDPLMKAVQRDYPELESLTHITVGDLPSFTADTVSIAEQAKSVMNIDGIKAFKGLIICSMTTTDAGSTIITGDVDDEHTHITVVNRQGKVMRQFKKKNVVTIGIHKDIHFRSCSNMSLFKVASTCRDREVGIYDTHNGTYMSTDISDITSSWVEGHSMTCVATDRISKNVFVGSTSRNVVIFDNELNYCRTLHLPEMIEYSYDISIHDGHLLVCDYRGKRAYVVTTERPEAELVCELPKPDYEGGDWGPIRVCTDSNGFIYILWRLVASGPMKNVLTQHSQDGRELLITKSVDGGAFAITTTITGDAENLLLAISNTGKMCTYGLVFNE